MGPDVIVIGTVVEQGTGRALQRLLILGQLEIHEPHRRPTPCAKLIRWI